jgi:hypothetical protein
MTEQLQITVGADPEMFCKQDGNLIAVQNCGILGTKYNPQPLPSGGNVQRDNVAIEFGVVPAHSKGDFVRNIGTTMFELLDVLPNGVDIDITPSANFPMEQLTHRECKEFGCMPDFNAWTGKVNEPPPDAGDATLRSCGGHIHIGYIKGTNLVWLMDLNGKVKLIQVMDCNLGIVSAYLDDSPEAIQRRALYGQAGCYRSTEYGVEYRTLSNFWIKSPKLVELMYDLTHYSIQIIQSGQHEDLIDKLGGPVSVQKVISEGHSGIARAMIDGVLKEYYSDETFSLIDDCKNEVKGTNVIKSWKGVVNV